MHSIYRGLCSWQGTFCECRNAIDHRYYSFSVLLLLLRSVLSASGSGSSARWSNSSVKRLNLKMDPLSQLLPCLAEEIEMYTREMMDCRNMREEDANCELTSRALRIRCGVGVQRGYPFISLPPSTPPRCCRNYFSMIEIWSGPFQLKILHWLLIASVIKMVLDMEDFHVTVVWFCPAVFPQWQDGGGRWLIHPGLAIDVTARQCSNDRA